MRFGVEGFGLTFKFFGLRVYRVYTRRMILENLRFWVFRGGKHQGRRMQRVSEWYAYATQWST